MKLKIKPNFFNPLALLALIILAQCALILFYAGHKKNFYMDEVATLLTSNDSGMAQTGFFEIGRVYSGDDLKSAITIGAGERFKFGFVKRNLLTDPFQVPFYFFLFHAAYSVYSFFSDGFSLYPGIILNLVFFVLTSLLLYNVSRFIFGRYSALLSNILWGFSTAAINSVLIIRPYALLACIFVLLALSVFRPARAKNMSAADCILLGIAVFFGVLTHYHFLIFAVLVLFCFFVFLIRAQRYKDLIKSASTVLISFLAACLCYPIIRILHNLIATNSLGERKIFFIDGLIKNAYEALSVWLEQTFGAVSGSIIFWAGVVFMLFLAVKFLIDKKQLIKINFFAAVCFTSLLFVIITWQSLTYRNWHDSRYLWPAYPAAAVFFLFLLDSAVNLVFSKNAKKKVVFAAVVVVLTAVPFFKKRDLVWLYSGTLNLANHENALAVGINDSDAPYALLRFSGFVYDLSRVKNFVILGSDPAKELDELLKQRGNTDGQLLLLLHYYTSEAARNNVLSVLKNSGYSNTEFLFERNQIAVFSSFHKQDAQNPSAAAQPDPFSKTKN